MILSLDIDVIDNKASADKGSCDGSTSVRWDALSHDDILLYKRTTSCNLACVELDHDLILCDDTHCSSITHQNSITRMYSDITSSLLSAGSQFCRKKGSHPAQISGWNQYCKVAHDQARESYLIWRDNGKPRFGPMFESMSKTRSYFKYIFRKCKNHSTCASADTLANKLLGKCDKDFWKEVSKINSDRSTVADVVNNTSGTQEIADMWGNHFSTILNSSTDNSKKIHVLQALESNHDEFERFTVCDVIKAMKSLKNGKSSGMDSVSSEHLKYADDKLCVLLSILFNAMIIHNYIPDAMLDTIIVPIIKDKRGDISDQDNYRPLALTCVVSKLFEFVILHRYEPFLRTTANQFGFKQGLSTDICIFSLKQIIDFYNVHSTPVYACYLDASKAFDKLNHWHLFYKLIHRGIHILVVRILLYLYVHQKYCVRWSNCYSKSFYVSNGAPQGRILSPSFFNVYMDDLSILLSNSKIGCMFNGTRINHLFYADDTVILASSPSSLQSLLDVCTVYADMFELKFNAKKTKCMVYKPKCFKDLHTPSFILSGQPLDFTNVTKYLGCQISSDLCDDVDIKRLIRSVYCRGNMLISKFRHCSTEVKCKLFNAYCSSFYGITTWRISHVYVYKKLNVAYKKIFRALFKLKKESTTFNMLQNNITPFIVIERNLLVGFVKRIEICDNVIVKSLVNSLFYISSRFYKSYVQKVYV